MKRKFGLILTVLLLSSRAWALDTISASVLADHLNRMPYSTFDPRSLSPVQREERMTWAKADPEILRLETAQREIVYNTTKFWGIPLEAAEPVLGPAVRGSEGAAVRNTVNSSGSEICIPSPFHIRVLDAIEAGTRVLDLGSAFGYTTRLALAKGATVVAVDMSALHIAILVASTPVDQRNRLSVSISEFPEKFTPIPDGTFDVVVAGLLIHFLPKEDVKNLFLSAYRWLTPGGKFFVMAATPYLHSDPLRGDLLQQVDEAKKSIVDVDRTPDAMVFPTDLSSHPMVSMFGKNGLIHAPDADLTRFNLRCAGFYVGNTRADFGTFSIVTSRDRLVYVSVRYDDIGEGCIHTPFNPEVPDSQRADNYVYARAVKPAL